MSENTDEIVLMWKTLERMDLSVSFSKAGQCLDVKAEIVGPEMPEEVRERTVWNVERIVKNMVDEKLDQAMLNLLGDSSGYTFPISCSTYDPAEDVEDESDDTPEFETRSADLMDLQNLRALEAEMEPLPRTSLARVLFFRLIEEDEPENGFTGVIDDLRIGQYPSDKIAITEVELHQIADKFKAWALEQFRERQDSWYQTMDADMGDGPVCHSLPDIDIVMGNVRVVEVEEEPA